MSRPHIRAHPGALKYEAFPSLLPAPAVQSGILNSLRAGDAGKRRVDVHQG